MAQRTIHIELPDDLLNLLNESYRNFFDRVKRSLAIHLYTQEIVSIRKTAQIAGMSRLAFENLLADHRILISPLGAGEIEADARKLKQG